MGVDFLRVTLVSYFYWYFLSLLFDYSGLKSFFESSYSWNFSCPIALHFCYGYIFIFLEAGVKYLVAIDTVQLKPNSLLLNQDMKQRRWLKSFPFHVLLVVTETVLIESTRLNEIWNPSGRMSNNWCEVVIYRYPMFKFGTHPWIARYPKALFTFYHSPRCCYSCQCSTERMTSEGDCVVLNGPKYKKW